MPYSSTEKSEIKKQAKLTAGILGDNFADIEKQASDAQTEFLANYTVKGQEKIMAELSQRKFSLKPNNSHNQNGGQN